MTLHPQSRAEGILSGTTEGPGLKAETAAELPYVGAVTLSPAATVTASEPIFASSAINPASWATAIDAPQTFLREPDPSVPQSWTRSDSPDFETAVNVVNSADNLAIEMTAPVPEASTWIIALLATLFAVWHGRHILASRTNKT